MGVQGWGEISPDAQQHEFGLSLSERSIFIIVESGGISTHYIAPPIEHQHRHRRHLVQGILILSAVVFFNLYGRRALDNFHQAFGCALYQANGHHGRQAELLRLLLILVYVEDVESFCDSGILYVLY